MTPKNNYYTFTWETLSDSIKKYRTENNKHSENMKRFLLGRIRLAKEQIKMDEWHLKILSEKK